MLLFQSKETQTTAPHLFNSQQKKFIVFSLALVAVTLLVFNPASQYKFLNYDDDQYVTEDIQLQSGLSGSNFVWAFTAIRVVNWHPLTLLSYMLDYQLFRLNPAGYHFMNVVYHILCAVLLFFVLHRGTGHLERSFCVAVVFALHPLNVESVAWISERKNMLSTMFLLLAIWAYGCYALRPSWKRYSLLAACFASGLMAKAMVITLPFALLLLDIWPLCRVKSFSYQPGEDLKTELKFVRKSWPELVSEKIPLFLLSAASAVITIRALAGLPKSPFPFGLRIENAIVAYVLYLYKMLLPHRLTVFYPIPTHYFPIWVVAACAIIVLGITITVLYLWRRQPYFLVGWLWFLGTLVPVTGIVHAGDQAMADRYAYVPLLGIFVAVIWGIADWSHKLQIPKYYLPAAGFFVLIALSVDTRHQLQYWHDSVSLWSHASEVTATNNITEVNLANALEQAGRSAEALVHYQIVARVNPRSADAHYYYASSLLRNGRPEEGIVECRRAAQLAKDPRSQALAHALLGWALAVSGRNQEARVEYVEAIRLDPQQSVAYLRLGMLEESERNSDEAIMDFTKSIQIAPSELAYLYLARNLENQSRLREALIVYQQAARNYPTLAEAQQGIISIERKLFQDKKNLRSN